MSIFKRTQNIEQSVLKLRDEVTSLQKMHCDYESKLLEYLQSLYMHSKFLAEKCKKLEDELEKMK